MLTNPPASWGDLQASLEAADPIRVQRAIVIQLEYRQPSAELYNFLTRTLELSTKSNDQAQLRSELL